jgi:environmental stress-induced protein Ves
MADIAADGPFSAFAGVDRWFAVVTGNGVVLGIDGLERTLRSGDAPFQFPGAPAPDCRLVDGPTRDLNLMTRHGRGAMKAVAPGLPWRQEFAMRGLFASVPGRWSDAGTSRMLGAHTLLWDNAAEAGDWTFEPDVDYSRPVGWWLGFSP